MSLEAAPNQLGKFFQLNRQLKLVAVNGAIGGFCYGYGLSSMGVALLQAKRPNGGVSDPCPGLALYPLPIVEQEMVTSFITLGAFVGSCLATCMNCQLGRRGVCLIASLILAVGSALMALSDSLSHMLIARIVTGVGLGIVSHTVPLYVSECAPPDLRGAFCFLNALMIPGGQVGAAIVGSMLFNMDLRNGWRWMLGLTLVPAVLMLMGLSLQPESPRWLLSKGKKEEAKEAFALLRGQDDQTKEGDALLGSQGVSRESQSKEFDDMLQAINAERLPEGTGGFYETFWMDSGIRRALMLGCFLMFMNQCVGTNIFLLYGPSMLQRASGQGFAAETGTCFTDDNKFVVASNILFPFLQTMGVVFALFFVESVGRRPLILVSTVLVAVLLAATGAAFSMPVVSTTLVLVCVASYLIAFGIGLSPVPWAVNAEIYPVHVRAHCLSIALAAKWLFGFLTSQTYLSLALALSTAKDEPRNHPDGIFWFYGLVAMVAIPILWRVMVETKGLTLEQTKELFKDSKDVHMVH